MPRMKKCAESACSYETPDLFNLRKHAKTHLKCKACRKSFATTSEVLEHEASCSVPLPRQCALCSVQCSSTEKIEEHLRRDHTVELQQETKEFNCQEEFSVWKKQVELSQRSYFRVGATCSWGNKKVKYFSCHRSGQERIKSDETRLRHVKKQGSNKINAFCPARMHVTFHDDGKVTVLFVPTHVGHDFSLGRLNLDKEYRAEVAAKMIEKIPLDSILDKERELIGQEQTVQEDVSSVLLLRSNLISRKDLHNIAQEFHVNKDIVRHRNDATSTLSWIRMKQTSGSTLVRYYKFQGDLDPRFPSLRNDDFVLVLMNDAQLAMLKKFGTNIVCMDGTHGTNQYGFELTTVLVLDENQEGFPVAFLFSSRADTEIMTVFLQIISELSGCVQTNTFLTDITDIYYNAWVQSMSSPNVRLYCSYHVDRAWRKNIRKVKGSRECQMEVYRQLKVVQHELDPGAFERMFPSFLEDLIKNDNTKEFGDYLSQNYTLNTDKWAYCYRVHSGINTNMHLERMHGVIKYDYMHGKKVKRMDKCLHALDRFLRDRMYDRIISKEKGGKYSKKLAILRQRHRTAVHAKNLNVSQISETCWLACSSSLTDMYTVRRVKSLCENCETASKCGKCRTCLHMFLCSCFDNAIKKNMCKHIHKVCLDFGLMARDISSAPSLLFEDVQEIPLMEDDASTKEVENAMLKEVSRKRPGDDTLGLEQVKAKIIKIMETATNAAQIKALHEQAKHMEVVLQSLASKPSTSEDIPPMPPPLASTSKKTLTPQKRFIAKQTKKRKRNDALSAPSVEQKKKISLSLIFKEQ